MGGRNSEEFGRSIMCLVIRPMCVQTLQEGGKNIVAAKYQL